MFYTTLLIFFLKIEGSDIEFMDLSEMFPLPPTMEDLGIIDFFPNDENETLDDILQYHKKLELNKENVDCKLIKSKKMPADLKFIKNSICNKLYPNFTVDINNVCNIDKNNLTLYKNWLDFLKFLNQEKNF